MCMKLRRGITSLMIGPCCRMFELSGDHLSSCDRRFVSTSARLYIFLYGFQRFVDTFPMSNSYSLVITDESGEGDRLRCTEGCIPTRPVFTCRNLLAEVIN